tara:strand:- start:3580 stop:3783 length:204 start_codon:yes stop_codon:yes gene_type:complete
MINYFLIGIIFLFYIELTSDWLKKNGMWPYKPETDPFNMWMRVMIVLIWPLGLLSYLNGFIKQYLKK